MNWHRQLLFVFGLFALWHAFAMASTALDAVIPPIVVKAKSSHKNSHSLSNGPKTTLTQQQIHLSGSQTLSDVLKNLAGVQLQDITGSGTQVALSLRGFGSNASSNTLFMINGIPLNNPDLAPPDLSAIPLNDIQSIEIMAGSESVLYGDAAVGGVINLITQTETPERARFSCSMGSYLDQTCYLRLQQQWSAILTTLSIYSMRTDNYRQHNHASENNLSGDFIYPYARGRLHVNYQLADEFTQYPGPLTASEAQTDRRQSTNSTDYFRNNNGSLLLDERHQVNDHVTIQMNLAHRGMEGHGILQTAFTQSRTLNFIKPIVITHWEKLNVQSGVDWQQDDYRLASLYGLTQADVNKYGLFSLATLPMTAPFSLSIGARLAQQETHLQTINDTVSHAFATTFGGNYQITPTLSWYLRRAGSFRFPNADEEASATTTPLRTQNGIAYESGLAWQALAQSVKLDVYQLNLVDEIAFDPTQTAQNPFGTNRNLEPTERRGFNLSWNAAWNDHILLNTQWQHVNARFQQGIYAGNRIPLVAQDVLHGGVSDRLTDHWTLYGEALFTGNQYAANDDGNVAGKMGGYPVYNVNVHYEHRPFSADLRINNIFNKPYYLYTVYQPSEQTEAFYPAAERTVIIAVNYALAA